MKIKCAFCRKKFRFKSNKKYCSAKCRARSWQERNGWKITGYYELPKEESQALAQAPTSLPDSLEPEIEVLPNAPKSQVNFKQSVANAGVSVLADGIISALTPEGSKSLQRSEFRATTQRLFKAVQGQANMAASQERKRNVNGVKQALLIIKFMDKYGDKINLKWIRKELVKLLSILR